MSDVLINWRDYITFEPLSVEDTIHRVDITNSAADTIFRDSLGHIRDIAADNSSAEYSKIYIQHIQGDTNFSISKLDVLTTEQYKEILDMYFSIYPDEVVDRDNFEVKTEQSLELLADFIASDLSFGEVPAFLLPTEGEFIELAFYKENENYLEDWSALPSETQSILGRALDEIAATPEGAEMLQTIGAYYGGKVSFMEDKDRTSASPLGSVFIGDISNVSIYRNLNNDGLSMFSLQRTIYHELQHIYLGITSPAHKAIAEEYNESIHAAETIEAQTIQATNIFMEKYYGEEPRRNHFGFPAKGEDNVNFNPNFNPNGYEENANNEVEGSFADTLDNNSLNDTPVKPLVNSNDILMPMRSAFASSTIQSVTPALEAPKTEEPPSANPFTL